MTCITLPRNKFLLAIVFGASFLSYQSTRAVAEPTLIHGIHTFDLSTKVMVGIILCSLIQLSCTEKGNPNRITFEEFHALVKKEYPKLSLKKTLALFLMLWNDYWIGFKGKSGSMTVSGTKISIPSNKRTSAKTLNDGETIEIIYHDGEPSYGILGTLWPLFTNCSSTLGTLSKTKSAINALY